MIFFTGEKHIIKGAGDSIRKQEILFIVGKYTEKDSTSFLFFSDCKKIYRISPRYIYLLIGVITIDLLLTFRFKLINER